MYSIEDIWNYLQTPKENQTLCDGFPETIDEKTCNDHFSSHSAYKTMVSGNLTGEDREYLKRINISEHFLNANKYPIERKFRRQRSGNYYFFRNTVNKTYLRIKPTVLNSLNAFRSSGKKSKNVLREECKVAFQDSIAMNGYLASVGPRSGAVVTTSHSLIFDMIDWRACVFYRFCDEVVYYIVTDHAARSFRKQSIFIPEYNLVYFLDQPPKYDSKELFDKFKSGMASRWKQVAAYLYGSVMESKTVALITFRHFAHHLWNELSGLERLASKNLIDKIDEFIILNQPIAPITRIFDEINTMKKTISTDRYTQDEIISYIYENNCFVFRAGSIYITESLVRRIHEALISITRREVLDEIKAIRTKHFPIVWFSLRTDYRVWIGQAEGISSIINELNKKYPDLGVIFDGFSLPYQTHDKGLIDYLNHHAALQREEMSVITKKINSQIVWYDKIGIPVSESILWSFIIDAYVCHHGSIQHKIGWIANKPGVIHVNKFWAVQEKQDQTIWARENAVVPITVYDNNTEEILAQKDHNDLRDDLNNYTCDWKQIYDAIETCIGKRAH